MQPVFEASWTQGVVPMTEGRISELAGLEAAAQPFRMFMVAKFARLAHQFSLKSSQGSDYHGPGISFMEMGRLADLPSNCVPVWQDWPQFQSMQ
jgi:hypothetical protein